MPALLVSGEAPSAGSLADLAERTAWPLPEQATMVALSLGRHAAVEREALDCDVRITCCRFG